MLELKKERPLLIGCVHLSSLPGAAGYSGDIDQISDLAIKEAQIYVDSGFDAVLLENMHDVPYLKGFVYPETVAAMAAICSLVRKELSNVPIGLQILSAANREALGVAIAAKLDFVRVEGFAFAHVADEGFIEASAAQLIRIRNYLKADNIKLFADIKKKHSSHAVTDDISIEDTAEACEFMKADGVVITGKATGKEPCLEELKRVKESVNIPVMLGSGITPSNIKLYSEFCDAFIIGSYCKVGHYWKNTVSWDYSKEIVEKIKS